MSFRDKMEAEFIRQNPHLGQRAPQPTSKHGPGLTDGFPIYEREMEVGRRLIAPPYPPPLQAEPERVSVERGSKVAPETSRARSDVSPNQTIGSDISLRPDGPLNVLEPEDLNLMDQSGAPTGTGPRVDPLPGSPSSPKNGSGSFMAYHGSEAAPLDLETR